MNNQMRELLEAIDRKAEAGLCQFTIGGIRAFHQDIRLMIKEALAASQTCVAKPGLPKTWRERAEETEFDSLTAADCLALADKEIKELRAALSAGGQTAQAAMSQEQILKARMEGRAEALKIVLNQPAEDPFCDSTHSSECGATGEWDTHWDEAAMRKLFRVDDATYDAFDKTEAMYWEYLGYKDEAQYASNFASNFQNSGAVRDALSRHGEHDLVARLCTTPAPQPSQVSEQDKLDSTPSDNELLDFVTAHPEMRLGYYKKRWHFKGFTNYEFDTFKTPREAIAAAIAEISQPKPE